MSSNLANDIRQTASEFKKLADQIAEVNRVLKSAGINQSEWDTFLNHADEPALWEEDRGN